MMIDLVISVEWTTAKVLAQQLLYAVFLEYTQYTERVGEVNVTKELSFLIIRFI